MGLRTLDYVGGPRHGGTYIHHASTKVPWPPKRVECYSEIPVGDHVGVYRLRGATLEWHRTKPHTIKKLK